VNLAAGREIELSLPMESKSQIGGSVFHDLNKNGVRDAGEPGVAGVTDSVGRFSLEVPPGTYTVELVVASLPARFEPTTPTRVQVLVKERAFARVQFGAWQRPREIIVTFVPPVARFAWSPERPKAYETVTLDASESYDPNGRVVKYEWDLEVRGKHIRREGKIIQYAFPEGTHRVTLTVTDNDGLTDTTTRELIVTE